MWEQTVLGGGKFFWDESKRVFKIYGQSTNFGPPYKQSFENARPELERLLSEIDYRLDLSNLLTFNSPPPFSLQNNFQDLQSPNHLPFKFVNSNALPIKN